MSRSSAVNGAPDVVYGKTGGGIPRLEPAERHSLEQLWLRHRKSMIARATRLIVHLRIDETDYDADEAVDNAILRICSPANRGKLGAAQESSQLLKLFFAILKREILAAKDRTKSLKQGGGGLSRLAPDGEPHDAPTWAEVPPRDGFLRRDIELDQVPSPRAPVGGDVIEEDCFEAFLEHLDSPLLRTIASMRRQGYHRDEIADRLHLAPRTIQRKLAIIRSVFRALNLV
jgi:DNA-directed RNA polymerase specialized sigma24 family protein